MKEIFSYTKLFTILIAIFYIAGLVGYFYNLEIVFTIISFIVLSLLIIFFNIDTKKSLILFFIFILGLFQAKNSEVLPTPLDSIITNATLEGQIISSKTVSEKNNKIKFYFNCYSAEFENQKYDSINSKFLINIDKTSFPNSILIGDTVKLKGKLRHPKPATNPYQFDYEKYLLNNNVKNILYASSIEKIKSPDFKSDWWFSTLQKFDVVRNKIIEKHSKNIKSPRLEILGGIVFGSETVNPDEEIKENFKNSGLLHLLAASGLNVALIYGIWWWIASLIRFPYNLSILFGAIFVIFYTFMTGFPPSILRASAMLLFVLFGKIIDRNANSLALIFFVGFLMLLFSPKMLFDVGFQLSFIVTIGLVVCVPVIMEKFEKLDKKYKEKYKNKSRIEKYFLSLFSPTNIAGIITIPLVAQLFVIPLQMHYFNNLAPFSLFANIAVVSFIGLLSFIGFISSIIALIPILNEPIIYIFDTIANPLLWLLIKISEFFSSFKTSLISTPSFSLFQIFSFWGLILLLTLNLKYNFKNKKQIIALITCFIVFLFSFIKIDNLNNNLEITMFDVDNADSFLIKTPKNKYILIDTGKKSYRGISSAQMIINKYLKNERINKLETLIITHFDSDHCAGAIEILKEVKVHQVIIKDENATSETSKEILNYLKENKINYKLAKNDEEIYQENNLTIKTFLPATKNKNESSIITLLNCNNKNVLFMADVGVLGFKNVKKYLNQADIIKIGHHGAQNSINQEMINKIKPKYALISTGQNSFNHPHYLTINLLNKNNIEILSTKHHGFVKAILNKNDFEFYYFENKTKKLKKLNFANKNNIPFHKSEFVQNFIKQNLN